MTTIHKDDVTEEEHTEEDEMVELGIFQDGVELETFDVHYSTLNDQPVEVADELHEAVALWLEHTKEHIDAERD